MSLLPFIVAAAVGLNASDSMQSVIPQQLAAQTPVGAQPLQTESEETELVIDILYQPGHRCVIAPSSRIIERNLTQPYRQQTLYGTDQCRRDD